MSRLEIWNGDRKIAVPARYSWNRPMAGDKEKLWPGLRSLSLFYFKRLPLEPPVLFEHLSGVALSAFLDHCMFKVTGGDGVTTLHEDLRYIHGRSEVMRGNHEVSAVVLAKIEPTEDFDELRFRTQIPDIYRELLAQMIGPTEQGT